MIKQEHDTYATPDSLMALTFRDPETGMTYVQTQLLQVSALVKLKLIES
jgi:hypothetical protein